MREIQLNTVLVSGGASGIGAATVDRLLIKGVSVVATFHNIEPKTDHANLKWIKADLSLPDDRAHIYASLSSEPNLSGVVNAAGINIIEPIDSVSPESVEELWQVNFFSAYELCRKLAPYLQREEPGKIVNVASIWAEKAKPGRSNYAASKAALLGMTRALAVELGPSGVLVNSVSPGFTATDLTSRSLSGEELKKISNRIPLGRLAQPSEVAEVIAFLVGTQNTYITGQNIIADGGFSVA